MSSPAAVRRTQPAPNVLVATDFSATAERAVAWAVALGRARGARLHLVHAVKRIEPAAPFSKLAERLLGDAEERLDATAARLRAEGLEVSWNVEHGQPSRVICDTAVAIGAHLVAIGTRGLSGFGHLLLGSTAERVVQRASCPVLTVHPGDDFRELELRAVLVPTDFSQDAELAAHRVQDFFDLAQSGAHLILLHTFHVPIEANRVPWSVDRYAEWVEQNVAGGQRAHLDHLAEPLRREGLTVEVVVAEGDPVEVIVREAAVRHIDLIAMGTRGRSGLPHVLLGSVAERVVQRAPCPVFTVHWHD